MFNIGGRVIPRWNRLGERYNISKIFPGQILNFGVSPQNEISLKSTLRIFSEFNFRVTSSVASNNGPLTVCQISKKSIRRNTLFWGYEYLEVWPIFDFDPFLHP